MTDRLARAPRPSHRLVPSRFPPVGLFDTVATAADLAAVMDLVGWTNDRLVSERIARLPQEQWVHGRANASVVMAAFLHVAPGGSRFNGPDLGAWYAADDLRTAAAEVGHHLRREASARSVETMTRQYRAYSSVLEGEHVDIRGRRTGLSAIYAPDSYDASQAFGERVRAEGGAGILYDSVRRLGGVNVAAFRPRDILDVVQADHLEITVSATTRGIEVRRLSG